MSLNAKQMQHIEGRLREERDRLMRQLQAFADAQSSETTEGESGDLSRFPTHLGDLGTDVANEELDASIATRRSSELAEIDAALERITKAPETFGLDENSGEPIPFERLDIIPWARTTAAPPKAQAEASS